MLSQIPALRHPFSNLELHNGGLSVETWGISKHMLLVMDSGSTGVRSFPFVAGPCHPMQPVVRIFSDIS
jgi:hypothetical protein